MIQAGVGIDYIESPMQSFGKYTNQTVGSLILESRQALEYAEDRAETCYPENNADDKDHRNSVGCCLTTLVHDRFL